MSSGLSVGEQLAGMLNMLKFCDPSLTSPTGEVSLMSLVWPLLPLLPPQPSHLLTELMKDGDRTDRTTKEKCCMCEKPGKNVASCSCENTPWQNATYSSGVELRQRSVLPRRPSLDRMVDAIEHEVDEKLNSIEQMTIRNNELDRQKKELYESGNSMNDAELLNRLQCLVKKKQTQEHRLKELETKKQKMEDSLITAITLAKGIESKGQNKTVHFRKHDKPLFGAEKLNEMYKDEEDIFKAKRIPEDILNEQPITGKSFKMFKDIQTGGSSLFSGLKSITDKTKEIGENSGNDVIGLFKSIKK